LKNGDVMVYNHQIEDELRGYINHLHDGDIVIVLSAYSEMGEDIAYCVNKDREFGFVKQVSLIPTRIERSKLAWGPKFIIGDTVWVTRHDHPWGRYGEDEYFVGQGMIYETQQEVVDVYLEEGTGEYMYDLNRDYFCPVLQRYLTDEEETDEEIIPGDMDEILVRNGGGNHEAQE